jgi:hypothetical protein
MGKLLRVRACHAEHRGLADNEKGLEDARRWLARLGD